MGGFGCKFRWEIEGGEEGGYLGMRPGRMGGLVGLGG